MTLPANRLGALRVEYQDDAGAWHAMGVNAGLGTILRTRRFTPGGPGETVTARRFRMSKVNAYDFTGGVVSLDQVQAWIEHAPATPQESDAVRLWSFNFDTTLQRYIHVVTPGNIEVYNLGTRVASIPAPYDLTNIAEAKYTQELDTLLAFHSTVAPQRIMRQGAHSEWDSRALAMTKVPIYDFDGKKTGGVNEVQQIKFVDFAEGETFNVTLEANTTSTLAYTVMAATMAARLQDGLCALDNVGDGGCTVVSTDTDTYSITYAGDNAAEDIGDIAPVGIQTVKGGVFGATLTQGVPGGEPMMSATRGWPACGTFYQQRLWMAGLQSRPETVIGSELGNFFDFTATTAEDAVGLSETLDTDEVTAIRSMFPGRHLQVFTSAAEFYVPSEPITPKTFAAKLTTNRGVQAGTPQVMMDGSTLFICDPGNALADFVYDIGVESYTASHLTVMASHLLADGIVDMGYRQSRSTTASDLAVMVRSGGGVAVMVALRDQDVCGFMPWDTAGGRFLACRGELRGDLYVAVSRTLPGGGQRRTLERIDDSRMLDSSAIGGAGSTLAGLDHLEGQTVCLYVDGADAGDAVVSAGAVALPYPALRTVEAGLLFQPTATLLPIVLQQDPRGGASMRPRAGEVNLRLGPTANLQAGILGGKLYRVPLKTRPNALLDQGPGENAFTGWTRLWGIPGFRPDAQVTLTQARPGPMQIEEVVVTVTS